MSNPEPRFVNWSANRRSPWHRQAQDVHENDGKVTLCGAVMTRHPEWSHGTKPVATSGKTAPRFCEVCAERANPATVRA